MKGNNLLNLFMKGFLKSFLLIAVLIGTAYGSYKLTMHFYKPDKVANDSKAEEIISDMVSDVPVEKVSKAIIVSVDHETGKISRIVLEIFNTYTCNMDYITIPANTQFTLSNELYQKINALNQEVPQIVTLSDMNQYFSGENDYQYDMFILEDLLGIDIHYYSVLDDSDYSKVFTEEKRTFIYQTKEEEQRVMTAGVQVFSPDFLLQLEHIKDEPALVEFVKNWYKNLDTNLAEVNKLKYVADYLQVEPDYIYYHSLYGEEKNGCFFADQEVAVPMLKELERNTVKYQEPQPDEAGEVGRVSEGLKIRILNGSGISGLASAYKDILTLDLYNVTGIANYVQDDLEITRIVVKQEGMGLDLLKYFNEAVLETGQTREGTDIEIILGKKDRR